MAQFLRRAAVAAPPALLAEAAFAHNGSGDATGFTHYLLHALPEMDTVTAAVIAITAAGLFAAWLGRRLRAGAASPSARRNRAGRGD